MRNYVSVGSNSGLSTVSLEIITPLEILLKTLLNGTLSLQPPEKQISSDIVISLIYTVFTSEHPSPEALWFDRSSSNFPEILLQ